ncbi:hypothetical protein DYB37_011993 [Aphanomyces astaci]|uniref:MULE transposase domain-containing protein n=1 Tax=Aphanomyces astaci TaxID=112090 RepID=A0A418FE79_APHAT|nr:hypothetical protein DYB37_011993 [Aphanomyces astaci]
MGVHNANNEIQRTPKVTPEMKVAFRGWLHQDTMRTPKDMLRLLKEALAKQEIALLGNELLPTLQQIQGAVKTIRCKEFGHLSTTEAAEAELAKWVEPERGNVGDANRPFAFGVDMIEDQLRPHLGDGGEESFRCGLTTFRLMDKYRSACVQHPNTNLLLHIDSTFKTNKSGYPVFVVG